MTLRALMTLCAIGTLTACGLMAHGQTAPPPGGGSTGGTPGTPFPLYWNPTGPEDANINFSGLPIQRGKSYMFYEHLVGRYPRVWTDPANGRVHVENEGIPQKTNWNAHVTKLRRDVIAALPDPEWDGMAIIDFESWHPNWDLFSNEHMKTMSRDWVRARFPALSTQQVERRAHEEFESAGMDFMVRTIQECKALRPRATWGFYGYPYNGYPAHLQAEFRPLFDAVDAFFPPLYATAYSVPDGAQTEPGQRQIGSYQRYVQDKIQQARALAPGKPIYAIVWMRYHDMNTIYRGQFINNLDVQSMFSEPWRAGVNGAVFWDVFSDRAIRDGYNAFFAGRGGERLGTFLGQVNPPPPPPMTPPIQANSIIRAAPPTNKAVKMAPPRVLTAAPATRR